MGRRALLQRPAQVRYAGSAEQAAASWWCSCKPHAALTQCAVNLLHQLNCAAHHADTAISVKQSRSVAIPTNTALLKDMEISYPFLMHIKPRPVFLFP
jgi:hypothetical protein